jgi:magnesium transporter
MSLRDDIARAYLVRHPAEAADALDELSSEAAAAALGELDADDAAAVLAAMDAPEAARLLRLLPADKAGAVVGAADDARIVAVLLKLDRTVREALLSGLPSRRSATLRVALSYPADCAAAIMDSDVFTVRADASVAEVRRRLRSGERDLLHYVYVVNDRGCLDGVLDVRTLLRAAGNDRVDDLFERPVTRVAATTSRRALEELKAWRRYRSLPVTDHRGLLLGVIRHGTLRRLELESEEAEAGLAPLEVAVSLAALWWEVMAALLGSLTRPAASLAAAAARGWSRSA